MPNSPENSPSWSSEPDDLDGLLFAGRGTPPSADLQPAADVVAALTAPPSPGELRGLDAALRAFRSEHGMSPTYPRHRYRARRMRARFVVAGSAFAVAFGGATAAAFTGVLPPPAQKVAHALVGAPPASAASSSRSGGSTRSTRTAPGGVITSGQPRVTGLCTAYRAASKHGHTRFLHSTSFQRLAAAAGGVDRIDAFCAAVPSRGAGDGRNAHRPDTPGRGRPSGSSAPTRKHPGGPPGRSAHSSRPAHQTRPGKGLGRTRSGSPSAHPHPHGGSPSPTG